MMRGAGDAPHVSRHRRGSAENLRIPPVSWLVAAAGCALLVALLTVHGLRALENQRLVDRAAVCGSTTASPCLERVRGALSGPHFTRRAPGNGWTLSRDGTPYDSFDLPGSAEDRLQSLDGSATVLARDGDVVAVEVPGDDPLPTWTTGRRGAATTFVWALLTFGFLAGFVSFAHRRRRSVGSWWRRDGAHYVNPASPIAILFVVPGALGSVVMSTGIAWWPLWLMVVGASFLGILPLLYRHRARLRT